MTHANLSFHHISDVSIEYLLFEPFKTPSIVKTFITIVAHAFKSTRQPLKLSPQHIPSARCALHQFPFKSLVSRTLLPFQESNCPNHLSLRRNKFSDGFFSPHKAPLNMSICLCRAFGAVYKKDRHNMQFKFNRIRFFHQK